MELKQIRVVDYLLHTKLDLEKVADVYKTNDYSLFTTFKSNREPDHVGRIEANIIDKGYVSNPIIVTIDPVTGKFIIVDGNNRFHALKELNLPVSFVILNGATEGDMVALNIVSKNWNKIDYIRLYANKGLENYITFLSFVDEYPDFKVSTMEFVLKLSSEHDGDIERANYNKLERGNFVVKDAARSREILDFCMQVKGIASPDVVYNQNHFVLAIMRLFRLQEFDQEEMLAKLNANKRQIIKQVNVRGYIEMLEEIYNTHRKGGKVHFDI